MELNELRMFIAVAREESVTRAAETMHCVQSNVTARIRQLEEQLGTSLFQRRNRGMHLTASGDLLLEYAEKIINLVSEAEQAVREQDGRGAKLSIGSMETTAAVRLPELLFRYHQLYSEVELSLHIGTSEESITRLLDYQLDGAFVGCEVSHGDLVAEKAFDEELTMVVPRGGEEILQSGTTTILVFRSGCAYRARLEEWLRQTGQVPYRVMELGSTEAIIGCVAAGMGISFLPRSVVDLPRYSGTIDCRTLPPEVSTVVTWFVRRKSGRERSAMKNFFKLISPVPGGTGTDTRPVE
ncbi:MAG: LysR family transcriptional regulator [Desulfuromonadaceae bacterium]|nr:LysR family transcriptional regulator [Desulfuromonadaceae bacterium]